MAEPASLIKHEHSSAMAALRLLTLGLGVFFLFMSINKVAWLTNPNLLTDRFTRWMPNAAPYAKVYLRNVAIPGGPVFARVVPVAEFLTAMAFFTGVLTNVAAGLALFMIFNFHTATSSFSSIEFLRDGTG